MKRMVLIEWVDATGTPGGWARTKDWQADKVATIYTAGFLLVDGKKCKRVACTYHDADDDLEVPEAAQGIITIPVRCIVNMVDLTEKPEG